MFLCTVCGIDMGPTNPRQLCGKYRCVYESCMYESNPKAHSKKRKREDSSFSVTPVQVSNIDDIPSWVSTKYVVFDCVRGRHILFGYTYFKEFESLSDDQKSMLDAQRSCCYFHGKPCSHYKNCTCNGSSVLYKLE